MRTAVAGVALLLAAVTGCSSEAAPAEVAPLASGGAVASPSPSASVPVGAVPEVSTASPTVSQAGDPRTPTPEPSSTSLEVKAGSFTERFFAVVNEAYLRNDATSVRRLSTASCGSCEAVASDIERLAMSGHVVAGRRYILESAVAAPRRSDGKVLVDFRYDADPYVERAADGAAVQTFPAQRNLDGQMLIDSSSGEMRVAAIRLVDP